MSKLSEKYKNIVRSKISNKEAIKASDFDDPIAEMTIEWTDEVIHQLQAQADLMAGHVTQLGQELKQVGKKKGNGYEISISAPFYWKFFNYGVTGSGDPAPSEFYGTKVFDSLLDYKFTASRPHPDMVESIREWIPTTGLFSGAEDFDSVAYGISVNILKRGLEPKPFVEVVFKDDKIINEFTKDLAEVTQVIFEELFKERE